MLLSSHLLGEVQQVCDRVAVIDRGRVLAESTVDELRGQSELVVAATPSDIARTQLEAMPGVERVRSHDGVLRVRADDRHTADINRVLVSAGVAVTELRRDERHLEDVFLEMTDHTLTTANSDCDQGERACLTSCAPSCSSSSGGHRPGCCSRWPSS